MKKIWALFLIFSGLFIFIGQERALARENIIDWYIQDFDSTIMVNKDSSLDITEKITVDCGNLPEKHGIYRILPEKINLTDGRVIKTPIELLSITDFNGKVISYTQSRNYSDGTVTWKIGDANKTVQGVNHYLIHYHVKNAIRFGSADFDELYWNLNGNFWQIETDKFHASIVFPSEITKENSQIDYYAGNLGSKEKKLATYIWNLPNTLDFYSTETLGANQGITVSVAFPKNIFVPYKPEFWEKYGGYLALLIPCFIFFVCFYLWWKYGKDPRMDKTIIPEYDAPGNLSPIELGMLKKNGSFDNSFITAEIINLATKKLVSIKELDEKFLFFHSKDYELTRNENPEAEAGLNEAQKIILGKIFGKGKTKKLSSLRNNFYKAVNDIKDKAKKSLERKKLIIVSGLYFKSAFVAIGAVMMFSIFFIAPISGSWGMAIFVSGLIMLIFGFIMPKRTSAGAELNWKIKGFKLFMETVDKDRVKFYEKENIFEKFLPYAIVFGMTKQWIDKMKEIYGEEYFSHYVPVWYAGNVASFNADSFASTIDSLSSSIASNTSSPSGSGGGGGAGGGGGGGGGGGW